MYIRDAQGNLRWIPPPVVHRQTIQNHLRNRIQREEWERFNAPPPAPAQHHQSRSSGPSFLYSSNNVSSMGKTSMIANSRNLIHEIAEPSIRPQHRYISSISRILVSPRWFNKNNGTQFVQHTDNEDFYNQSQISCTIFGSSSTRPCSGKYFNVSPDECSITRPERTSAFQSNSVRGVSYGKEIHHNSKMNMNSCDTIVETTEKQQSGLIESSKYLQMRHDPSPISLTSHRNESRKQQLEYLGSNDYGEELSYIVDTISVAKTKSPQGMKIIVKKPFTINKEANACDSLRYLKEGDEQSKKVSNNFSYRQTYNSDQRRYQKVVKTSKKERIQHNNLFNEEDLNFKNQNELADNVCQQRMDVSNCPSLDEEDPSPDCSNANGSNAEEVEEQHSISSVFTLASNSSDRENRPIGPNTSRG